MDYLNNVCMCFLPIILLVVWAMGLWFLGKALALNSKAGPKPDGTTLNLTDTRVYYIPPSGVKSYPTVEITQRRQE